MIYMAFGLSGLSDECEDAFEMVSRKYGRVLDERERRRYFLSEGMGMELWGVLNSEGFSAETLESIKNELKQKDLLKVRKVENVPSYYFRFSGKLTRAIGFSAHQDDSLSRGHASIEVNKQVERVLIDEELLKSYIDDKELKVSSKGSQIIEQAYKSFNKLKDSSEATINALSEKGIRKDHLELDLEDETLDQGLADLESMDAVRIEEEEVSKRKSITFISEWAEFSDEKTRFFFHPTVFEEYLG